MPYTVQFRAGSRERDVHGRPTDDPRAYWTRDHWVVLDSSGRWADGMAWPDHDTAVAVADDYQHGRSFRPHT